TSGRMQALLLRFLENGEIWRIGADRVRTTTNVRVIAATNRDLVQRIKQEEFREDLYYRLNVLQIVVPPLRQSREDIPAFLNHFISRYCQRHAVPVPEMMTDVHAALV